MKKATGFATVQVRRDSPAYRDAARTATGEKGNTINSILREKLDRAERVRAFVLEAMAGAQAVMLDCDDDGHLRAFLNRNGIYNSDLDWQACLVRLVQLVEREVK
jgi:hypothetical protein